MTVFIGGPLDGQHREVPKSHGGQAIVQVRYPTHYRVPSDVLFTDPVPVPSVRHLTYNKLTVFGVEFFAEASLPLADVMHRLLESYNQCKT